MSGFNIHTQSHICYLFNCSKGEKGKCVCDIKANATSPPSLTFRRPIRSGHNHDAVQEQILKKLLENHGVGDVRHLKSAERSVWAKASYSHAGVQICR